jgi:methionine synthase I (cobalamin-dependent)
MHFLSRQKVWVFDGAMGTMIQNLVKDEYACPEELNLTHPEIILKIH